MRRWLLDRPEDYVLIQQASDVALASETGRLAVAFDIEGAKAIGDQISLLENYRALAVRWMLLAYNRSNRVGGGCQDEDMGLTPFGRDVVQEMERLDMLVCLSHTGHRTARDVLAMAQRPVIFSHSNPATLRPYPRNIPDELIRACAETGGVVGISGIGAFLGDNDSRSEIYARHIDHVVKLVGAPMYPSPWIMSLTSRISTLAWPAWLICFRLNWAIALPLLWWHPSSCLKLSPFCKVGATKKKTLEKSSAATCCA
ncbi:MAG: dipeptidase [Betaproteobacteria bacterium]|jgi:membrane dipeptidase